MTALHMNRGGASALPLALLSQAVPMLTRNELAALTERLIDALDRMEPDPEAEDEPDEEDDDPAEYGGDIEHNHHPVFTYDQTRSYC